MLFAEIGLKLCMSKTKFSISVSEYSDYSPPIHYRTLFVQLEAKGSQSWLGLFGKPHPGKLQFLSNLISIMFLKIGCHRFVVMAHAG